MPVVLSKLLMGKLRISRKNMSNSESKPAFLRRLGPCVTKEELESVHQKIESLTRIFEEMSLFF